MQRGIMRNNFIGMLLALLLVSPAALAGGGGGGRAGGGGEERAVVREGERAHRRLVAAEAEEPDELGLVDVPHAHRAVSTARRDVRDVWMEGRAAHVAEVAGEEAERLQIDASTVRFLREAREAHVRATVFAVTILQRRLESKRAPAPRQEEGGVSRAAVPEK